VFHNRETSILMIWWLPKNLCRNRFFSTPLQIIVIVLRYFRDCGKLFSPSFQKMLWCVLVNQVAVFRDFEFRKVKSYGGSVNKLLFKFGSFSNTIQISFRIQLLLVSKKLWTSIDTVSFNIFPMLSNSLN